MTDVTSDAAGSAETTERDSERAATRRLRRVTFDYSATEDRLLARMLAADGELHAAWLTQRLTRRLVKALLAHLDKTVLAEHPAGSMPSSAASTGRGSQTPKDMMMGFRHQAALMNREPAPPVAEVDTRDLPLLETIHARLSKNQAVLTMELRGGPAALTLTHDHAWQLLQILLNLFRRAEWPTDSWPEWMRDGETSSDRGSDTQVLH